MAVVWLDDVVFDADVDAVLVFAEAYTMKYRHVYRRRYRLLVTNKLTRCFS